MKIGEHMLKYAEECKMAYLPGREAEYIKCILKAAQDYAMKSPIGKDKNVVNRATEALVRLQRECPNGVPGQQILREAGLVSYRNSNSHGLWPWLEKSGGLPVVKKLRGGKYIIVDKFYPALSDYFLS